MIWQKEKERRKNPTKARTWLPKKVGFYTTTFFLHGNLPNYFSVSFFFFSKQCVGNLQNSSLDISYTVGI